MWYEGWGRRLRRIANIVRDVGHQEEDEWGGKGHPTHRPTEGLMERDKKDDTEDEDFKGRRVFRGEGS